MKKRQIKKRDGRQEHDQGKYAQRKWEGCCNSSLYFCLMNGHTAVGKFAWGGGIIKLYYRGLRSHVELLVVES